MAMRREASSLFLAIRKDPNQWAELVPLIFKYDTNLHGSPDEEDFFCDNFPVDVFLDIVLNVSDQPTESMAIQCLAHASESPRFRAELFANDTVLFFLLKLLQSDDLYVVRSSFQLMKNVVKKSAESRDFLLTNGLLEFLKESTLEYPSIELLLSICSVNPPMSECFVEPILALLASVLDGAPILDIGLALDAILALLKNGTTGVNADDFLELLGHLVLSQQPAIVPLALEIILYATHITEDIYSHLVELLESDENPAVLKILMKVLLQFSDVFQPSFWPRVLRVLRSSQYSVQICCVRVLCKNFGPSWANDLDFFEMVLSFLECHEVVKDCLSVLRMILSLNADSGLQDRRIEKVMDSYKLLEDLAAMEDEQTAELAALCLEQIEIYRNHRSL
jgi:hypothetical protein